jgi:hypothetical protein
MTMSDFQVKIILARVDARDISMGIGKMWKNAAAY